MNHEIAVLQGIEDMHPSSDKERPNSRCKDLLIELTMNFTTACGVYTMRGVSATLTESLEKFLIHVFKNAFLRKIRIRGGGSMAL
jgi:hypothetical protein